MPELTLRPDQFDDLAALIAYPRHGLWNEPGTGKTPTACLYTQWNYMQGRRTVWVQPLAIAEKNRDELLKFTEIPENEIALVRGTLVQRKEIYDKKPSVLLMGADMFGREWEKLGSFSLLIGDEWHMMYAGAESKRTLAMFQAVKKNNSRACPMTGTLVRGKLSSAYSAIHVLEPNYYASYKAFLNYHAVYDDWGNILGWKNEDKLREILERHGQHRTFESIYGDVPVVFETHYVKMSPEQERCYREFEEKAILELEDMFLTGANEGVNLIRARELLSCPEKHGLCKNETTGRDALLEVQIEDHLNSGAPWMIGSACKPEQVRLLEKLNKARIKTALLNGDTPHKKRGEIDVAFQRGNLQCVIVSPAVGSIGFNWGHCDHVTNCHLGYMADDFEQFWRRTTRGKRTRPVLVDTIVYKKTVEEPVLGILIKKMEVSKSVDPTKQVINLHVASDRYKHLLEIAA